MTATSSRALRVLQVSAYAMDRFGGVQSHVRSLSNALRAAGHEVKIVSPGSTASDDQSIYLGKARIIAVGGTKFEISHASTTEMGKFNEEMAKWQPDLVHFHGLWVPLLPYQVMRAVLAARVVTFHDTPPPGLVGSLLRGAFRILSRVILKYVDAAIAVSDMPLRHLRSGRSGMNPIVMPPVVDLQPFLKIKKPPLTELNSVLFWGRFEDRKGIDVLLQAIQSIESGQVSLPSSDRKLHFVLAGKGAQSAAAQQFPSDNINTDVEFIESPSQAVLLDLLAKARMVVLPSLYGESFGIVIVEAMASGTPVIVADNPGYRSALGGNFDQLLVPPGDALALAKKIIANFDDAGAQKAQAVAARSYSQKFDASANIDKYLNIYRAALDHAARSNRLGREN